MVARAGRPSKLTPDVTARICAAVRLGATYRHAAMAGGISVRSLYDWLERGEAEAAAGREGEFRRFLHAVKGAENDALRAALLTIKAAADAGAWAASAWLLERRYPAEYGRSVRVHQGPSGGPIPVSMIEAAR